MSEGIINPNGTETTPEAQTEKSGEQKITYGFDEEGYFTLKIHESAGQPRILGWLLQCQDIVKVYFANKYQAENQSKIARPNRKFFDVFGRRKPQ